MLLTKHHQCQLACMATLLALVNEAEWLNFREVSLIKCSLLQPVLLQLLPHLQLSWGECGASSSSSSSSRGAAAAADGSGSSSSDSGCLAPQRGMSHLMLQLLNEGEHELLPRGIVLQPLL
jgi:hypothetical protein